MRKDREGKREGSHGSLGKSLPDRKPAMGVHGIRVSPMMKFRELQGHDSELGRERPKLESMGILFFPLPTRQEVLRRFWAEKSHDLIF